MPSVVEEQARSGRPFTFKLVRTEISNGVGTLTINRPDAMNALNEEVVAQLETGFAALASDPAVKGIAIAGSGKAFVAGADIRFFVRNIEAGHIDRIEAFTRRCQALLRAFETCAKPVIARVHGLALGGGVELALACHAIVAAPKATLAFPETGIGIYPGLGGTQRTTRRVGTGLAKWLVLTGQMLTADEALAIGLVDTVVAPEQLDATIASIVANGVARRGAPGVPAGYQALADFFDHHTPDAIRSGTATDAGDQQLAKAIKKVGTKAPIALRIAADLIDRGQDLPLEEGLSLELARLEEIFRSQDALEGLSSLGRKPPVFADR